MMTNFIRVTLTVMFLADSASAFANDIHHDLFARPLNLTQVSVKSAADNPTNEVEAPWSPQLIAIMVAGKNSLVNVDGEIIKLGDMKDGYRLVKVRDHKAVFRKGYKRIVLKMEVATLANHKERGNK